MYELLGPLAVPCIICLVVGICLVIAEMFVPGFGVMGFLGVACLIAVIVMQYTTNNPVVASVIAAIALLLLIIALVLFLRSMRYGKLSKSQLIQNAKIDTVSSPIEAEKHENLVGKVVTAVTPLRPTGMVELEGGKRINVQTYGNFVESGTKVEIVAVEGLNVFVK
ncbi:MAG TPA: NfeD family protein [Eubacteriales bacterium]|nr:NfeD family protein [Clostridia bacterium]HRV73827.1 NfeD family protein [Eubacteriales bacterium]